MSDCWQIDGVAAGPADVRAGVVVRALRVVPAGVPDVHDDVARGGLAAGADPTDAGVGRGGDRADGQRARAPGPVPRLPGVRDGVPERRGVSRADRGDARAAGGGREADGAGAVHAVGVLPRLHAPDEAKGCALAGTGASEPGVLSIA